MAGQRPGGMRRYLADVAALLHRRARLIAAFTAFMAIFDLARAWSIDRILPLAADVTFGTLTLYAGLVVSVVTVPALVEASGLRTAARIVATVAATFVFVAITCLAINHVSEAPLNAEVRHGDVYSNAAYLLRMGWTYSVAGLLFAAYCQTRDRQLAGIHAARTAELARADSQRDIVALRLQVLQARVEPELLFGALEDVRRIYSEDPAAADALLDDLIAYLRAALPHMRGGASTVGREVALAMAYLKVLPAGRSRGIGAEARIEEPTLTTPFPPMVLLPLVHAAGEAAPRAVSIVSPARGPTLPAGSHSLEVCLDTAVVPAGWSVEALSVLRGTLAYAFGDTAAIHVTTSDEFVHARLTWVAVDVVQGSVAAAAA